ncbi:hypothetical protein [Methylobacterium sp. CM6257]
MADLLARYESEVTIRKRGADREDYKRRVLRSPGISALQLVKLTSSALCGYRPPVTFPDPAFRLPMPATTP